MRRKISKGGCALLLVAVVGCDDSASQVASNKKADDGPKVEKVTSTGLLDTSVAALQDSDFVESEGNRDPFRSYADAFRGRGPAVAQRAVLMPNTPIEEMRLIAIITGVEQPRAMLVDEKGVGHVTTRGDFVGRAEVVQSGGAENLAITINWRIERIRENEVVLAREDPTGPNRPPLTRVIPLHEKNENGEDESG